MQHGNTLYSISWDDCTVTRYDNLTEDGAVCKTVIASLDKMRAFPATTLVEGRWLFVIGGVDGSPDPSASTWYLDLLSGDFSEGPRLNEGRYAHCTAVIGGCIYVIGGHYGEEEDEPDSIEKLNVAENEQAWTSFSIPGFLKRQKPVVCRLNDSEILVAGGHQGQ